MDLVCYIGTSIYHVPKIWIPNGKAYVKHKPYCMHRQLRHSEQLSGLVGTLQQSRFPYVNQGPAVQAGLSKYRDLRLAMFTFLPTEFLLTDFFLIVFILTLFTKEYFACCIKV